MPHFIALGLPAYAVVAGRRPAQGHAGRRARRHGAKERQVCDHARPLGVGFVVVGVPAVVAVLWPGGWGADTGAVAVPYEQAAFANAMDYVALSIAIEVPDRGRANSPAARKLRPAGGRKRVQARLSARGIQGVEIRVGAAVQQLL